MTEPLWTATDPDGDTLELYRRSLSQLPQVIGSVRIEHLDRDELIVHLEPDTARGMRDALDRLLAGDERSSAPDPASLYMGRRAAAIGRQLDEHVQALVRVTQRAGELDGAVMRVPLKVARLAEVVHLLAVQQQRVAASLGDLLSALAGGQP